MLRLIKLFDTFFEEILIRRVLYQQLFPHKFFFIILFDSILPLSNQKIINFRLVNLLSNLRISLLLFSHLLPNLFLFFFIPKWTVFALYYIMILSFLYILRKPWSDLFRLSLLFKSEFLFLILLGNSLALILFPMWLQFFNRENLRTHFLFSFFNSFFSSLNFVLINCM